MPCDQASDLIGAYLDGELDLVRAREMERHLEGCADCRRVLEDGKALRRRLRSSDLGYRAPERLKAAIARDLRRAEGGLSWRIPPDLLRLAAAVVVAALLGAAGTYWWMAPRAGQSLADEALASHVRSLLVENRAIDVASSDEHTVKPWFDGKLDFAPPVVDLTRQGFPLVGGRLDYLDGRPVAALVYRHRLHLINLFVWPAADAAPPRSESRRGYNVLHWADGSMTYWAVSDLNRRDLEAFGRLVQEQTALPQPEPASP